MHPGGSLGLRGISIETAGNITAQKLWNKIKVVSLACFILGNGMVRGLGFLIFRRSILSYGFCRDPLEVLLRQCAGQLAIKAEDSSYLPGSRVIIVRTVSSGSLSDCVSTVLGHSSLSALSMWLAVSA